MVRHDIRRIPGLIISPRLIRPHDFPPWPNFPRRYKPLRLEHHSVVFLLSSIAAIVTAQAEPATATSLILPSSTSVVNASDILSYHQCSKSAPTRHTQPVTQKSVPVSQLGGPRLPPARSSLAAKRTTTVSRLAFSPFWSWSGDCPRY